jgi:outer membrane protein assembly factor BamB
MKTVLAMFVLSASGIYAGDWLQFGGPGRNFVVDGKGLAASWPESGPKKLWSRELGEGYSSIVAEGPAVYTMYRRGTQEVVIAMDAKSGKTIWEYAYDAPFRQGMGMENGSGPHSTPLIIGDRIYSVGILALMHAFDRKSGKLLWKKDLYSDFPGSTFMGRGYSSSPLAYKNTIILQLGGPGHAVVALKPEDGSTVWAKQDFPNAPSSPQVISVDGQEQLVTYLSEFVVGLNPNNGELLWQHQHKTDWNLNITLPVWCKDNILLLTSAYSGGARALQLKQQGGKTTVKELWANKLFRVHHGTAVSIGDYAYGSSGDFGPAPLSAVQIHTGEVVWRDRNFPKTNFVRAGDRFVVVDEDGNISLAEFAPKGARVISKAPLLSRNAWTAPTLVGTTVYVRDRRSIAALDLSQ